MKRLHHHLCKKSPLYHKWHQHPLHKHVHWGLLGAVALGVALSFVMLGWSEVEVTNVQAQEANITIDGSRQYQTIDGWGANSQEGLVSAEVYQAFVEDLGATIVRIPFPAAAEGAAESANDNPDPSDLNLAAFDITRQVYRKEVSVNLESVKRFRDAGVDKFLLAVFSPPLWMKEPPVFAGQFNQVPVNMYPEFAETLIGVIKRFAQEGITIQYINLQGEDMCGDSTIPHTCWGEGNFAEMMKVVGPRLRGALPNVRIEVADVSRPTSRIWWSVIKSDSAAYQYADIQAVHYYEWGESQDIMDAFAAMGSDVLNDQKPLWITETGGPGFNGSTADTFQEGFNEAQKIHQSFTIGNASAFLEYVAYMDAGISGSNPHRLWRLIELQSDGSIEGFSPKYYAMKRYARNIPPGSKRIEASGAPAGVKVSAFTHTNGTFTIVAINTTGSDQGIVFRLSGGVSASSLNRYRFSSGCDGFQFKGNVNSDCDRDLGPITVSSGSFMDSLPSQSITTFTTGTANVPPPPPQVYACSDGQDNDVDGKIDYRTDGTGDPGCSSSTDTSEVDVSPPADGWTFCANENGFCSFSGTKEVRYGANGSYNYLTLTGGTQCSNAVFGDPINSVVKQCYYRNTTTGGPVCPNGTCEPPSETNSTCPQDCGSTQNQPSRNPVLRYLGPTPTGGNLCGNGTLNTGEQCDGTNLNGQTCQSLGFQSGILACFPPSSSSACQIDTSGCTNPPAQVCTPNQTCVSCYTSQNCAGVCNAQGTAWVDAVPNDGCPAIDTSGPPYPRLSAFTWGGAVPWYYAQLDLIDTGNSNPAFAQAIKALNPNTRVVVTKDIQAGFSEAPLPQEWRARASRDYNGDGKPDFCVIYGGSQESGPYYYDITDAAPLSAMPQTNCGTYCGQRYNQYIDDLYRQTVDLSVFDGVATDGLWDRYSGGAPCDSDIDLDRNGQNDYSQRGKQGVDNQISAGALKMIQGMRAAAGPNKLVIVNSGGPHTYGMQDSNGFIHEHFIGHFGFDWNKGVYENWMANAVQPVTPIVNTDTVGGSPITPHRNDFPLMRYGLTFALVTGSYFDFTDYDRAGEHYWVKYYDEYDTDLGYPLGPAQKTPSGAWVRFFDNGMAITNGSDTDTVTVRVSEVRGMTGYNPGNTGFYHRFRGGQDLAVNGTNAMNNGDPFDDAHPIVLKNRQQLHRDAQDNLWPAQADGIILLREPQAVVSDIIIDNWNSGTSPGSRAPGDYYEDRDAFSGFTQAADPVGDWCGFGSDYYTTRCSIFFKRDSANNYMKDARGEFVPSEFYHSPPFATAPANSSARAVYTPNIGVAGQYRIYEWHGRLSSGSLASNVTYTINNATRVSGPCGGTTCTINQQLNSGQWNEVGTYRFNTGTSGNVTISASGASGTVMADAVMFRYVGP